MEAVIIRLVSTSLAKKVKKVRRGGFIFLEKGMVFLWKGGLELLEL